jgi:hypothetical protein
MRRATRNHDTNLRVTKVGLEVTDGGHEEFNPEGIELFDEYRKHLHRTPGGRRHLDIDIWWRVLIGQAIVAAVLVGLVSFLIRSSAAKHGSHA